MMPQKWVEAFDVVAGLRYQTRFSTVPDPNAVGLFGEAGLARRPQSGTALGGCAALWLHCLRCASVRADHRAAELNSW
ncbi:hypothetical protein B2J88_42285 [Rhodococcus sp. SRB_17]|nr:hypothetical protein [Rhodococcus sp. SRB_17]